MAIYIVLGYLICLIILLPFCKPSKRIRLFFPPILFFLIMFTINFYKNNEIVAYILFLLSILVFISFLICILESVIRIFLPGFDFYERIKANKLEKQLRAIGRFPGQLDMYRIFPNLKNSEEYQILYNHCNNDYEKAQFTLDWKEYFIDLQAKVFQNPQIEPEQLFLSFDEWYKRNERWRDTSYHHLYYEKQKNDYGLQK